LKGSKVEIRTYGDPVLRKKAEPVDSVGPEEQKLFDEMEQVMNCAQGVGLAAPQVGISKQMIVVDVGQGPLKLANPKIIKSEGSKVAEEGCLSLPGVSIKVKRAFKITVEALNYDNQKVSVEAGDLAARAIQHEIDHLSGTLIVDRTGFWSKFSLLKKLRQLKDGKWKAY